MYAEKTNRTTPTKEESRPGEYTETQGSEDKD